MAKNPKNPKNGHFCPKTPKPRFLGVRENLKNVKNWGVENLTVLWKMAIFHKGRDGFRMSKLQLKPRTDLLSAFRSFPTVTQHYHTGTTPIIPKSSFLGSGTLKNTQIRPKTPKIPHFCGKLPGLTLWKSIQSLSPGQAQKCDFGPKWPFLGSFLGILAQIHTFGSLP